MNTKAIVIASALGVSTLVGVLATAHASTAPSLPPATLDTVTVVGAPSTGTDQTTWDPSVDPRTEETVDTEGAAMAFYTVAEREFYVSTSANLAPPPDDCAPEWRALIQAKDNYNMSIIGGGIIGAFLPPVGFGIAGKALLDLRKARKALLACCDGREKQDSCREAKSQNYLK